jgi:hypothetical protein
MKSREIPNSSNARYIHIIAAFISNLGILFSLHSDPQHQLADYYRSLIFKTDGLTIFGIYLLLIMQIEAIYSFHNYISNIVIKQKGLEFIQYDWPLKKRIKQIPMKDITLVRVPWNKETFIEIHYKKDGKIKKLPIELKINFDKIQLTPGPNEFALPEVKFRADAGERTSEIHAYYNALALLIARLAGAKLESAFIYSDEEIQELSQ